MAYSLFLFAISAFFAPGAWAADRPSAGSVIEAFSGTQKELLEKMGHETWRNSQDLFTDLARSNSYREAELLSNRLLDNNSLATRTALVKSLEANRANYANFIFALRKKAQKDPQALARLSASLEQVKAAMKAKKVPFPTPDRCATWVLTYLGVRSFFFSLRGTWGANEDPMVDAAFQPVADNGTQLAIMGAGFTCLAEFVLRRNELPQAIRAWRAKSVNMRQLSALTGIVEDLRKDPGLLDKARELKALSQLDEIGKTALLARHAESAAEIRAAKIERELESPLSLDELRRTYASEGRMAKVMKEYYASLSPHTTALLAEEWRANPSSPGRASGEEAARLDALIRKDFHDWIAGRGKQGEAELIDELLRQETELAPALTEKARARAFTAKVCMGMLAGGIALYGHMASIGKDPTNIDRPEDRFLREYHSEVWSGFAVAGSGACFLHVGLSPIYKFQLKKLLKNRVFYMNEKDWRSLRKMALDAYPAPEDKAAALARLSAIHKKESVLAEDVVNLAIKRVTAEESSPKGPLRRTCSVLFGAIEGTLSSVGDPFVRK